MTSEACDILAFAPHPDDAEIACGGTLLLLGQQGRKLVVVDATRWEKGTRGDAATRESEAAAATKMLGLLARENLGLADTMVVDDAKSAALLVAAIRRWRPRILLAPHVKDPHPDHVACSQLAARAFFLAGLKNFHPEHGAPHRPAVVLRYPLHEPIEPTLCIDITTVQVKKQQLIACYASQLSGASNEHFVKRLAIKERIDVRDRFYGAQIGVTAAEPLWCAGPLAMRDLSVLGS